MNDTEVCCSLKLNPNKNPQTNRLFTKTETNLKNNLINQCNSNMKAPSPSPVIKLVREDAYVPIIHTIDEDSKSKSIEILRNIPKNTDPLVNFRKSPISPPRQKTPSPKKSSPKKKTTRKSPPKGNKKEILTKMTYDELKKKYGKKIKSKMSDLDFGTFKIENGVDQYKYLSKLTKPEYILLILYLNL